MSERDRQETRKREERISRTWEQRRQRWAAWKREQAAKQQEPKK